MHYYDTTFSTSSITISISTMYYVFTITYTSSGILLVTKLLQNINKIKLDRLTEIVIFIELKTNVYFSN